MIGQPEAAYLHLLSEVIDVILSPLAEEPAGDAAEEVPFRGREVVDEVGDYVERVMRGFGVVLEDDVLGDEGFASVS